MIAAVAKNGVIGKNNSIPWNIPEDLKRFKNLTSGKTVIMGNKTKLSLKKPLLNRKNVVLTRSNLINIEKDFHYEKSIEDAIKNNILNDIYIIGGNEIYNISEKYANRIELTIIDLEPDGDTFFPKLKFKWKEIFRENNISQTGIAFSYVTLERDEFDASYKA